MLCGKQGIALHGHRDDHIAWTDEEELEAENEGNFIELVRFEQKHRMFSIDISTMLLRMNDTLPRQFRMN